MKTIKLITVLMLIVTLSGCKIWSHVKTAKTEVVYKKISVELPVGWTHFTPPQHLMLTKDGLSVQSIKVEKFDHTGAFDAIEKSTSVSMQPAELADLFITNFKKSNEDILVTVDSLKPYAFKNNVEGFEVLLNLKTKKGLTRKLLVNGAVREYGFVLFSYDAPELYYFKRDIKDYNKLIDTATL